MNKNQYDAVCASYTGPKDWDYHNVGGIELTYIIGAGGATAQVRQAGLDNSHVNELIESIFTHGQQVPVTLEDVGTRPDGSTQYRLVDGEHRYRAFMKLKEANPKDARWKHIRAYTKAFSDDWERLQYQSKSNHHGLPAKSNANSDAALMLSHVVDGSIPGLPASLQKLAGSRGKNSTSPKAYLKELQVALKTLYPDMSAKRRKSIAGAFVKSIPGKLRGYSANIAKSDFDDWAGDVNLPLTAENVTHTVKNHNYIDWQLIARLFSAKDDSNNKNDNVVIMFWSDIAGKDHDALDEHRTQMINRINKRNASSLLKKGRRLADRLFVAPQKQNSSHDEYGFYEVTMDQNGNFPTGVPTTGWDTRMQQSEAAK